MEIAKFDASMMKGADDYHNKNNRDPPPQQNNGSAIPLQYRGNGWGPPISSTSNSGLPPYPNQRYTSHLDFNSTRGVSDLIEHSRNASTSGRPQNHLTPIIERPPSRQTINLLSSMMKGADDYHNKNNRDPPPQQNNGSAIPLQYRGNGWGPPISSTSNSGLPPYPNQRYTSHLDFNSTRGVSDLIEHSRNASTSGRPQNHLTPIIERPPSRQTINLLSSTMKGADDYHNKNNRDPPPQQNNGSAIPLQYRGNGWGPPISSTSNSGLPPYPNQRYQSHLDFNSTHGVSDLIEHSRNASTSGRPQNHLTPIIERPPSRQTINLLSSMMKGADDYHNKNNRDPPPQQNNGSAIPLQYRGNGWGPPISSTSNSGLPPYPNQRYQSHLDFNSTHGVSDLIEHSRNASTSGRPRNHLTPITERPPSRQTLSPTPGANFLSNQNHKASTNRQPPDHGASINQIPPSHWTSGQIQGAKNLSSLINTAATSGVPPDHGASTNPRPPSHWNSGQIQGAKNLSSLINTAATSGVPPDHGASTNPRPPSHLIFPQAPVVNDLSNQNHWGSTSGQPPDHVTLTSQKPTNHWALSEIPVANNLVSMYVAATSEVPSYHGASTSQQFVTPMASNQPQGRTASQIPQNMGLPNQDISSQMPHGALIQVHQNHGVTANSKIKRKIQDQYMMPFKKFHSNFPNMSYPQPYPHPRKDTNQKKDIKKRCLFCNKSLKNLIKHYQDVHPNFSLPNLGFKMNNTVINIHDIVSQDHCCGICGYQFADKNALDTHKALAHRNDLDNSRPSVNNNTNNNVVEVRMYKCGDCSGCFEEKSKFDEHLKSLHGYEVMCKVCNKNFRFKDFQSHVKDNHPDVENDKNETVKNNMIAEECVQTNKGKKIVFKCTKTLPCKNDALEYVKMYKNEPRGRDVGNRGINHQDVNTNYKYTIIYICEVCNIGTASINVLVEHSQRHIINPDVQFSTKYCDRCCLKFEPICYVKHVNLHCTNKETRKESFVCLRYKHHLLLTDDWLKFFKMSEVIVNRVVSRSIYAKTRSIIMRVISGESSPNTLYQCGQCDNFVDPSEVRSHTENFDTCVQIETSSICNICGKSFYGDLARDSHEAVHNDMDDKDSFRIVLFNADRDRESNYILNDVLSTIESQIAATNNDENNSADHVIYKCSGCSLCFILKESADNHIKVCPRHKGNKMCQICENWFNIHEFGDHNYKHHFIGNISLIINNIVPNPVLISDDESTNENDDDEDKSINDKIPSIVLISDDESRSENGNYEEGEEQGEEDGEGEEEEKDDDNDDDEDNEGQLKISFSDDMSKKKKGKITQSHNADAILDNDNENKLQISETKNVTEANLHAEENNRLSNLSNTVCTARDAEPMVENSQDEHKQSNNDEDPDHSDIEVSIDTQSKIISGERSNTENDVNVNDAAKRNERIYNLGAEIETTRLNIYLGGIAVKRKNPCYEDKEDTNMDWGHAKQRKESNVTSVDTITDITDSTAMLTDDEDEPTESLQIIERADVHVNSNYHTSNPVISVDGAYNPRNNSLETLKHILRLFGNSVSSNSNSSLHRIEESSVDVLINETSRNITLLSGRRIVVNTDKKVDTKDKIKSPQNEQNQ